MTTPGNPGDERLRRASKALWYELAMLRDLYSHLRDNAHEARFLRNAHLESFLIHARQIYDFFYNVGRNDDIFASEYFSDKETWDDLRDSASIELKSDEWRCRINKEVVHITNKRGKQPDIPQHDIEWIYSNLNKIQEAFREHASPLHERWRKYENPTIGDGVPCDEGEERADHADGTGTSELP